MIDIENELFTLIATELRANYTGIFVSGDIINAPPQFPCVYILQSDSTLYEPCFDSSEEENFTQVAYEINVYSNLKTGKKSQAKAIIKDVDKIMRDCGFMRIMLNSIPNADSTIYRMTARYKGVVNKNNIVYRR